MFATGVTFKYNTKKGFILAPFIGAIKLFTPLSGPIALDLFKFVLYL